jgi:uncharacterized protein (TIGR02271 family)
MITQSDLQYLNGADVYEFDGDKIGSAGQVYLDNQTGEPEWVSVRTGMFGTKESFVPLDKATLTGDRLQIPFDKDRVKGAPRIDADGELSPADEDQLYTYYGLRSANGQLDTETADAGDGIPVDAGDYADDQPVGRDTSGPTTDGAMTRSEERLVTGTRTEQAGTARLRKYVVTEEQSVTVPVSREEVRLEREPITDGNVDDALDGPAISEEEHELTLQAERPVVTTEAVPVERVRLNKETVTDQETVGGEVRKEQIDFDGDTGTRKG